ncbi:DUF885 domain-containing protein [Pseudoalteromonas sp. MMG005]|uniref:DUF885 domain-containing protein n=1 Tax=Pseudoalteromonas sp. MMG005 TaxID=2822682 RepID=UPI001B3A5439|nr:DUF885 domain-containing protein [Pseudoalteromonas sp. MMG005]MBQ4844666.1 DUF885 domain-containing protein [Pseudoalteromonas sp. MMG005]
MKKTTLGLALVVALGLTACNSANQTTHTKNESTTSVNQSFEQFAASLIDSYWQHYPEASSYAGYGKYDDIISIPNAQTRASNNTFNEAQLDALQQFDINTLSANQQTDYYLIKNRLQKSLWHNQTFKSWQWNPSNYNVSGGFALLLNNRFKSTDEKLNLVLNRLKFVPDYYQAAQNNIENPTLEYTQLAIQQNQGAFSVLNDSLLEMLSSSNLSSADKALFKGRFADAKTAIHGYIDYLTKLEKELVATDSARSFRIGESLYEQKFAFDIQSGYTAKQMYQKALADKDRVTSEMIGITNKLWPKYFPATPQPENDTQAISKLIKHLSVKHVDKHKFVDEISTQIPALEAFVKEKDLITLDADKPLVVRKTPEYMRGYAMASISSPGPYESKGNTFYNVEPLGDMDDEKASSYLREYNHWILQILNIHEAIPGHYTQLVYANKSPSLIKSLFSNGAMIEGWAVYTERMMLEEGYGNFEPEMWLMYYKWNLRVICNTILDYAIHVEGLSKEAGLDLLMNGAFQEQAEAQGKWRRATLSQVQLTSYYSGYREIYDLREAQKVKLGNSFDLKIFHETFLSFGSAPVKYITKLMQ